MGKTGRIPKLITVDEPDPADIFVPEQPRPVAALLQWHSPYSLAAPVQHDDAEAIAWSTQRLADGRPARVLVRIPAGTDPQERRMWLHGHFTFAR